MSRIGIGSKRPYRNARGAIEGNLGGATRGGDQELIPLEAVAPIIGKVDPVGVRRIIRGRETSLAHGGEESVGVIGDTGWLCSHGRHRCGSVITDARRESPYLLAGQVRENRLQIRSRGMPRVALVFPASGNPVGICQLAKVFLHKRTPIFSSRSGVDVHLAGLVIGPVGQAGDDGIGGAGA